MIEPVARFRFLELGDAGMLTSTFRLSRGTLLVGVLLATWAVGPRAAPARAYQIAARIPSVLDGHPVGSLRFDPISQRLFGGNVAGLYSADLAAPKPGWTGPLVRTPARVLELAPDLGRVFYAGPDELGSFDEQTGASESWPRKNIAQIAYEPVQHELYVWSGLSSEVQVLDARTGGLRTSIKLPGWSAIQLTANPGRVFLQVGGKDGIYSIEADSHTIAPWPVEGIRTPGRLEPDPSGRFLFLARRTEVDAIDVPTRTVTGRLKMSGFPSIGFDPAAGQLIVFWVSGPPALPMGPSPDFPSPLPLTSPPSETLKVFRPTAEGLLGVANLGSGAGGGGPVPRTGYGFLERHLTELLVWSASPRK